MRQGKRQNQLTMMMSKVMAADNKAVAALLLAVEMLQNESAIFILTKLKYFT